MSISSRITNMTTNISNAYDSLEKLGQTADNKNLENLSGLIDNIYDNAPKTEYQEGTEVNLGKTIKGKLDYDNGVVGIGQTEQDGTPTPDTPIAINSVTGNQDVVVSGKNLFDKNAVTNGYYVNAGTGELSSGTSAFNASDFIPVSTGDYVWGVTTTTGYSLVVYDKDKHYVRSVGRSITQSIQVTIAENEEYVRYTVSTADLDTQQFERGTTQTDYEPYITPTSYQLSLGDIELCKIGDYQDYIYKSGDSWYKHSAVGKYTFTGQEDFEYALSRFQVFDLVDNIHTSGRQEVYCNRYPFAVSGAVDYGIFTYFQGSRTQTYIYDKDYTNTTSFKTYLSNNNTYFYYILNTATDTEITDETLLSQLEALYNAMSINGTTIITSNGDLPMILKVRALSK